MSRSLGQRLDRFEALIALALARARGEVPSFVQRRPLTFTALYCDPQDVTGHASDTNPGTLLLPLLTTSEVIRRFFFGQLIATTLLQYLSDELGATGLDLSTVALGVFNLNCKGTPQITHTGGTLNGGTVAIDPIAASGGQRQTVHTTDVANWGPFVTTTLGGTSAHWQQLLTPSAQVWIMSGAGSATASVSRPVDAAVASSPAMVAGPAYTTQRKTILPLTSAFAPQSDGGQLTFTDFEFTAGSVGPITFATFAPGGVTPIVYNHCAFTGPLFVGGNFNDCICASGAQGNFFATFIAGGYLPNNSDDAQTGVMSFGGDVYVTGGSAFTTGATFYQAVFIFEGAIGTDTNTGMQIQDLQKPGGGVFEADQGGTPLIGGLLWGNGNVGTGLLIEATNVALAGNTPPSVTGTEGDFGFARLNAIVHTARPWDDVGDAYATARATTWANLAAAIGSGGFGGQAHDVSSNACIVLGASI